MRINRTFKGISLIILSLLLALPAVICSAASSPDTNEATDIVVGVPTDRCPVFFKDPDTGEITGIGVDLMQAAAEEAGYNASFVPVKEDSLKEALDNEEYDLVMPFGSAITSASGRDTIVSDNLMQTPFTFVTAGNTNLPPVNELKIGMLSSLAAGAETVTQLFPDIKITLYDSMSQCVKALRSGEVDALLHNSYVWSYVLQKPSYSKLMVQPETMFTMDFRAGTLDTPKGHELIESLNKGIAALPDTHRQAIVLDYTSRRLYRYDIFDLFYQFGFIITVFIVITVIELLRRKELLKAKTAAEEASKAKTRFLANMSHEIRTPINSVMGMGELISRETTDPKLQQYAYIIKSSSNSLLCLVNDILDFSRMEAGKLKLRNDTYHLSDLLTDVNLMIKGRADSKGLDYEIKLDRNIPNELIGDETRLKQVLINLLTNGVKYTITGCVNLIIYYNRTGPDMVDLHFTVKDTGIGLKQEDIDKLFKAFERFDEDRNRTVEGTGLGMSIVKQILDAMDSRLNVKSVYGKGSEFSFVVRQKVSSWDIIGDFENAPEKSLSGKSSYHPGFIAPDVKILSVDDTEINLLVLEGLLKKTKVQMDTATGGVAALKLLQNNKYDILFIDHRMPEMDGIELLSHIKNDPGNLNYNSTSIALTANVVEGEREICINAGFDDYLEKPVNGKKLEDMILKYLPADKVKEIAPGQESEDDNDNADSSDQKPCIPSDKTTELKALSEKGIISLDDGIEYAGSETLFLKTLEFFKESIDRKSEEIEMLYSEENLKDYTVKVHALKSSAKIIGAYDLSEKARHLELAGERGDFEFIRNNHSEMLEDYLRYKELLANI